MAREPTTIYLLVCIRWLVILLLFVLLLAAYVSGAPPVPNALARSHPSPVENAFSSMGPIPTLRGGADPVVRQDTDGAEFDPPRAWKAAMVFLLGIGVLAVVFAYWMRRHELVRVSKANEGKPFTSVPIAVAFEPQYAVLWDTQLPALQLLASAGEAGVPVLRLCSCYIAASHRYPELYDGCSFPQWLDFFIQGNLAVRHDSRVVLTADGREFLHLLSSAHEPSYPQRRPVA